MMSLEYVMLGLLSLGPRTGYDLKKELAESRILHWSGNSNQIYKTLLALSHAKTVDCEVVHQEKGPTKKVFTLSPLGRERLKAWLISDAGLPEMRNPFITRLLFAGILDHRELEAVILDYESRLRIQEKVAAEYRARRGHETPGSREDYLNTCMDDYAVLLIETELAWLRKLRARLPAR
jgi:DNA-binding PadR family transcriptional regulator